LSTLLQVNGLSVDIGRQTVCRRLDLTVRAGECWAVLGRNGAGKTTLLHHLAGLRGGHTGSILLDGRRLDGYAPRARAQRIGILLQHSTRGFGASVLQTVLTGRHPHLSTFAWEGAEDLAIAHREITALGLDALVDRPLETLSGGELRRVEIARLLTQRSRLALLDEPMNHLDLAHQARCLRVLRHAFVSAQHALLMIVHDLNLALHACDRWLILDGAGGWQAGPRETLSDPALLSRAFGHPIRRADTDSGPVLLPEFQVQT
jgi:iron complex transport system ATP-binding protein